MWDLDKEAAACLQQMRKIGIPYGDISGFHIAYKKRGWWGRCKLEESGSFRIDIHSRLVSGDIPVEKLREVIVHEILHTCPGCYNHGKEWKRLGAIVTKAYGYPVSRTASSEHLGVADPTAKISVPELIPKERLLSLRVGDFIVHDQFGSGIVVGVVPMGTDAILEIAFQDGTSRKLMQKLASSKMRLVYEETIL